MAASNEPAGGQSKSEPFWKILLRVMPTPFVIGALGLFSTQMLERWKNDENNVRLYTELMSRREESDNALRKDMFSSILQPFVESNKSGLDSKVLNLELLVQNFHESFELGPLFKDLMRQINREQDKALRDDYTNRIEVSARDVRLKQLSVVQESGDVKFLPTSLPTDEQPVVEIDPFVLQVPRGTGVRREYTIRLYKPLDPVNSDVRIDLNITTLGPDGKPLEPREKNFISVQFDLGQFDFPMIRNTRLPGDQRCAVVVREISKADRTAFLTVVCFPGTRASLRETPYVDEILEKLHKAAEQR